MNIYKCNTCSHNCEVRKEIPGIPQICLMAEWNRLVNWRKITLNKSLWKPKE